MLIYVLIGNDDIWEGTTVNVTEETETHYIGLASERGGTYTAEVEKWRCIEFPEGMKFSERLFYFQEQKKIRMRELKIDDILE
jgi:hypothetical protein